METTVEQRASGWMHLRYAESLDMSGALVHVSVASVASKRWPDLG